MTDTPLDLDAIEARANAVAHHRTGPGRCACGYDAYKVGGFFPDYHAMLMDHLALAPRAVTPANTDDVLGLVAALRKAEARLDNVLALADGWTLPTRKPFEPLPDPRESALSVAAVRIRAAVDGA